MRSRGLAGHEARSALAKGFLSERRRSRGVPIPPADNSPRSTEEGSGAGINGKMEDRCQVEQASARNDEPDAGRDEEGISAGNSLGTGLGGDALVGGAAGDGREGNLDRGAGAGADLC